MDIKDLLSQAPDLLGGLKDLGLSEGKIGELGSEVSKQLAGDDGFDMGDLLSSLNADSFLGKIDIASLASKVGISPDIAKSAIAMIAPKVAQFTSSKLGGLGKLASLASGFFGKK